MCHEFLLLFVFIEKGTRPGKGCGGGRAALHLLGNVVRSGGMVVGAGNARAAGPDTEPGTRCEMGEWTLLSFGVFVS